MEILSSPTFWIIYGCIAAFAGLVLTAINSIGSPSKIEQVGAFLLGAITWPIWLVGFLRILR